MVAVMRAVQMMMLCSLGLLLAVAADPAPAWACSPANTRNPDCPHPFTGNIKCDESYCPPYAGCAEPDCNAIQGNIQSDKVIALDAYAVKGSQCTVNALSVPECCKLCRGTEGCNAWSFCNSADGCGSGCDQATYGFAQDLLPQPWDDIDPKDSPNRLNPIHTCSASGAWPYGTCTLKSLAAEKLSLTLLSAAPLESGNQQGWISGVPTPVLALNPGTSSETETIIVDGQAETVVVVEEAVPDAVADIAVDAATLLAESAPLTPGAYGGQPGAYGGSLTDTPESGTLADAVAGLESAPQDTQQIQVPEKRQDMGNSAGAASRSFGLLLACAAVAFTCLLGLSRGL